MSYTSFFQTAFGREDVMPRGYQARLAEEPWPSFLSIPTGMGKTAAIVLAWLWKRTRDDGETPRRLVYCLPMRVLVEQTRNAIQSWLSNLELDGRFPVSVLMGGETADDWDLYPESERIIIGTQDMLLSRILNRGYGMSRYRWPMHYALLNNDCLWLFDEIQLMGTGLATSAQFHAFRTRFQTFGACKSIWQSATMDASWVKTVDHTPDIRALIDLPSQDKETSATYTAEKPIARTDAVMGDLEKLALDVLEAHRPGSRTLVILNTVERARNLMEQLDKANTVASTVLIHSRFRPEDRARALARMESPPADAGTIIVSTQVIEAGVDLSARVLFTELAPWASMVQRFGRCNRRGEWSGPDGASVYWIDLPGEEKIQQQVSPPYDDAELIQSRRILQRCDRGVGPDALESLHIRLDHAHTHVIRRRECLELFDTTPDLAGNDIDIDRYVRDTRNTDARVFWRDFEQRPSVDEPLPHRNELCAVPIGRLSSFIQKASKSPPYRVFKRNYLEGRWERVTRSELAPGQVYLIAASAGGYDAELGWTGTPAKGDKHRVAPVADPGHLVLAPDDSNDGEPYSTTGKWQSLAEHSKEAHDELAKILIAFPDLEPYRQALLTAVRWHDLGKAHWVFRHALPEGVPDPFVPWAKASTAQGHWKPYARRHFRHELASALAALQAGGDLIPEDQRDLVAYLVAAHHGKVRLSIRSLPREKTPNDPRVRFARGIWDGDRLPGDPSDDIDLGDGVRVPATLLSLEPMVMGRGVDGAPSWSERMLGLRDALGPFRLAFLESLVRAADMRVSRRQAEAVQS